MSTIKEHNKKYHTFSQIFQDVFALMINDYKFDGNCIDIGCNDPGFVNNSVLLQLFNWKAICIDSHDYKHGWKSFKNATFHKLDMTKKKNVDMIMDSAPNIVDFLSLDIDDACLECLKLIDLKKTKFKCICIEHNKYIGLRGEQRHEQREILKDAGYFLLIKNVAPRNKPFEDWWVNPDLVNVDSFKYLKELCINGNIIDYMNDINKFAPNHIEKIAEASSRFDKPTLQILNKIY
jgi:hypothetical protein